MANRGRPKAVLAVTPADRDQLSRWATLDGTPLALRSRIVLDCADGHDNTVVARRQGCSANTVGVWRARFLAAGIAALTGSPKPGRPSRQRALAAPDPPVETSSVAIPAPLAPTSRTASQRRQSELVDHIHDQLRSGALSPGAPLPSLRTLGQQFGLSRGTVQTVMNRLVAGGVLVVTARVGYTVAHPRESHTGCFLIVAHSLTLDNHLGQELLRGFERGTSRLGGASVLWFDDTGEPLPDIDIAGAFFCVEMDDRLRELASLPIPTVGNQIPLPGAGSGDHVRFDNFGGGRDATRHLLRLGHRRIAFLNWASALDHDWAADREAGWLAALEAIDPRLPRVRVAASAADVALDRAGPALARLVARVAVSRRDEFDAVVGVDDWAISGFLREWESAGLDPADLPAMVGFEELPEARSPHVSSARPPWDRLGEAAAELLWQRAVGQVAGPPIERVVPMEVTMRLNSYRSWSRRSPRVAG